MAISEEKLACRVPWLMLAKCFPFLAKDEVGELCPYLDMRELTPGELLMEEGRTGDFMAFVVEGKMIVKKETDFAGHHIILAVLEQGSMVGEIAAVERGIHAATVTAKEPSLCLILRGDDLERVSEENPRLGVKLLKRLHTVLGSRMHQTNERLARIL